MSRPTEIVIDLGALQHNVACVRQKAPQSKILAMVKSNAYGHGLQRIAQALESVDALGVACLEEGMTLRKAGITKPVVLMEGVFHPDELTLAAEQQFTLVVHQLSQVEMLEACPGTFVFDVWLKIDTGMHRLGLAPEEVEPVWQRLMHCAAVKKPVGLMSHFAETDESSGSTLSAQLKRFKKATAHLPGPRSLANSGAMLASAATHLDWIRPGIILYGASPWANDTGAAHGMLPVMSLRSRLIAVRTCVKNERIGYGSTYTCPEDMRIGVVAAGYGDGYPQGAINGTPVLVNGLPCPLAGRVSMDMLTVDLRTQPAAVVNDPVLLWGKELPVEEVARFSHSSAYGLLTRMTQRVHVTMLQAPLGDVMNNNERGENCAII